MKATAAEFMRNAMMNDSGPRDSAAPSEYDALHAENQMLWRSVDVLQEALVQSFTLYHAARKER